jgi:hypothetical protein
MTRKKMTGAEALKALRKARYTFAQIQAACEEFGFFPVSISLLSYIAKGERSISAELEAALVMAAKGLRVKP